MLYFRYLDRFLDQSIPKKDCLILKTEALVSMFRRLMESVVGYLDPVKNKSSSWQWLLASCCLKQRFCFRGISVKPTQKPSIVIVKQYLLWYQSIPKQAKKVLMATHQTVVLNDNGGCRFRAVQRGNFVYSGNINQSSHLKTINFD